MVTLRRESHVSRPVTRNGHHWLQFCLSQPVFRGLEGQRGSRLSSLLTELTPPASSEGEPVSGQQAGSEDQQDQQAGQLQTSTHSQQAVQTGT